MIDKKNMEQKLQDTMVQMMDIATGKTITLTPYNIIMIKWFMSKYKWEGDLSDFINEVIKDFFESKEWRIKIVQGEVLP